MLHFGAQFQDDRNVGNTMYHFKPMNTRQAITLNKEREKNLTSLQQCTSKN